MDVEIKQEIILEDFDPPAEEILGPYDYGKVKQEETAIMELKESVEDVEQDGKIEFVEVKQEEKLTVNDEAQDEESDNSDSTDSQTNKEKPSPAIRKDKHYGNNPRPCSVCHEMIVWGDMKRHLMKHAKEKSYNCDICATSFTEPGLLKQHKLHQHSEPTDQTYSCETCKKTFKKLDFLKKHQRREKKAILNGTFQCTECDEAFATQNLLRQHAATHGEKKFVCRECGKVFDLKHRLNYHSKSHMRPQACHVCGKVFNKLNKLETHKLLHTGFYQSSN